MAVDKNKIVAEATRFAQKGQYDKALKAYEKILAEDRREVRTLLKVGEIHQKKGDAAAAAQTFNLVAEIYGEQGFFLKAVAVYKQIAKLTPDDVRVNEKLAGLYQQLGLLNDATNQLQVVATAYESSGDQGRHLDVLRRLLDLDPENVATCQRLGNLYAKAGRTAEALELYRRAATHLRENRRGDEYVKVAERIFQLTPDDLPLARELAQEYLARGDAKKALGKLQVCHAADKQDVDTLRLMAQAFRDLGQVSKTIAVYRALARVYAERGRRDEAATTWKMVQDLLPDDPEARDELAAIGARAGPGPGPVSPPPARPGDGPAPAGQVAAGPGPRPPPVARRPPVVGVAPPPVVASTPVPRATPDGPAPAPAAPARPDPAEGASAAARILTEADVYLKYGLHKKALEHVQRILEADPGNPDALERVRDILDAMGDRQGAAEAAEHAVKALLERGDDRRIEHATERLRALDPSHGEVVVEVEPPDVGAPDDVSGGDEPAPGGLPEPDEEPLAGVEGVEAADAPGPAAAEVPAGPEDELPGEPAPSPVAPDEPADEAAPPVAPADEEGPRAIGADDGPAPLLDDELPGGIPAYAVAPVDEERPAPPLEAAAPAPEAEPGAPAAGGEEDASAGSPPPESPEPASPAPVLGDDAPLPIDDTGLEIDVAPPEYGDDAQDEAEVAAEEPVDEPASPAPPEEAEVQEVEPEAVEELPATTPPPLPDRHWPALDAELEELEFYERQGLRDEAVLAARELAAAHPGHPALAPILARVEGQQQAGDAGPPAKAPPGPPVENLVPHDAPPSREGYASTGTTGIFDLGSELSAELGPELTPSPTGEFQYSVADVFDQFKRGLERTVRPDDSATKYDLGIAFQEMGMLDEALEQFRSALSGGEKRREVEILSMIGNCLGMKGDHAGAVEAYRQALRSEHLSGEAAKALHFELGSAHEALGEPDTALWYFQKVAHGSPSYRGVAQRVSRLGGGPGRAPGEGPEPGPAPHSPGKRPKKR